MSTQGWRDFEVWHHLLDALCERRGWHDNNDAAVELCLRLGKNRRNDFEAAKKKLRTWRSGQRLPLRRNFAALGHLLEVESDPELERRWTTLYRAAQAAANPRAALPGFDHAPAGDPENRRRRHGWAMAALSIPLLPLWIYTGTIGIGNKMPPDLPRVNFEGYVRLPVGSESLIRGVHGSCKGPPPDWADIADDMPVSQLGEYSDGGLAREVVRSCGRERIVRAVRFVGLRPGVEELRLFGDYQKIEVVTIR